MDQSKPLLVAIIEDDAPSRTALGRLLRAAGFEPAHFESAEAHIDASPEPTLTGTIASITNLSPDGG